MTTPALTRDGGETSHPRPTAKHQRPMNDVETAYFMAALARRLDHAVDAEATTDGAGGVTVTVWADDEEGGVVTFAPITAVRTS